MSDPAHPLSSLRTRPLMGQIETAPATEAGVVLSEILPAEIAQIQAWPDTVQDISEAVSSVCGIAPDPSFNAVVSGKGIDVVTLAPGRWLVLSDQDRGLTAALAEAVSNDLGAVTDLGHARGGVRIVGPRAVEVMSKGLPIDSHPDTFPTDTAVQSTIHHIGVLVVRRADDRFDCLVFRGLTVSFWEWAQDASLEYGLRIV